jgi:D-arabinose 1-dehydrogenase-like Zn-dependent alcohol dehydrogenase
MAIERYGEPLVPLELPEPDVPTGFALLEVRTCGVCFSDVKTSRGMMPFSDRLTLPHVPGHEIFGHVVRTNPPGLVADDSRASVFHYWPCGRCPACRRGDETLCARLTGWVGFTDAGGFRERLAVPVDRLIAIPPSIGDVDAALMTYALGTAYRSVVTRGGVRAGSRVTVIGLGGVGIHAAQVARAARARVVGLDVSDVALAVAESLGLETLRADGDDAVPALVELMDGEGADVAIDTVGLTETLSAAVAAIRPGGRVVCVGYLPTTSLAVPTSRIVLGEVEVVGSRFAHRADLERAVALVARGHVRPVVGMVRPLEDVNEVFEALDAGAVAGRAVLDVGGVTGPTS